MKEPRRLLDDPLISRELREDLANTSETRAVYDAGVGWAALQGTLGIGPATGAPGGEPLAGAPAGLGASGGVAATTGGTTSFALKAALLAAIGGAVTLGGVLWADRAPHGEQAPPASVPATGATSAAPAVALEQGASHHATKTMEATKAMEAAKAADAMEPIAPARSLAPAPQAIDEVAELPARNGQRAGQPAASASRREIARMARIKLTLERDPATAHRMIVSANREFPGGVLQEERDGLDAIALFSLGSEARARGQAQRFLERYPKSPLRSRVERLLERPATDAP